MLDVLLGNNQKINNNLYLIEFILLIIFAWILVTLWTDVIKNFCFGYLKLIPTSVIHTTVVASAFTIIFFSMTYLLNINTDGKIVSNLEKDF